jgi:hypothetical protein
MRPGFAFVVLACALGVSTVSAAQPAPKGLTAQQIERLERGEPVQILEPTESVWPRSTVYQFIDATPEECAAVFTDYELQAAYIPRMKSARIVRRTPAETDVEYVISVPVYPDERSVSRHSVSMVANEYRVVWHTMVDSAARGSVVNGSATFRAMANNRTGRVGTVMTHSQAVIPSSVFAKVPFIRNKAVEASRDAASAIRRQIEHERSSDHTRLRNHVAQLRALLPQR